MRAVDTNVVVRYLVDDDPAQSRKSRDVIGCEPVFVPRTVLLETEWVLRSGYGFAAAEVISVLRALAGLPGITVEDGPLVAQAMDWAEAGMDFADALHLAAASHCTGFLTFDGRFARLAAKLGRIPVSAPSA